MTKVREKDFICGDCMKFLPDFPDKYFDVAIVDPPYFSGPEKRAFYGRRISPIGVQRLYKTSEQWDIPQKELKLIYIITNNIHSFIKVKIWA